MAEGLAFKVIFVLFLILGMVSIRLIDDPDAA
jgi:hypothetical protein